MVDLMVDFEVLKKLNLVILKLLLIYEIEIFFL